MTYNLTEEGRLKKIKNLGNGRKGMKNSEQHNKKLSEAHKGKKLSSEHKIKLSLAKKNSGFRPNEKYWFKKGHIPSNYKGNKSLNYSLRRSIEWKVWRSKVFERDNFTCKHCGVRGVYIEPHHIVSVKECIEMKNLELVFNIDNGLTLCKPCHDKITFKRID